MGIGGAWKLRSVFAALFGFVHTVRQQSVELFSSIETSLWVIASVLS
jgi:hypothetical protein